MQIDSEEIEEKKTFQIKLNSVLSVQVEISNIGDK